ncbi:NAD(P)/FAD-dependent oxidoreductase [Arthrobacter sp. KK5.5]|uniref:NAD(P)/FAD-dependent oxidoreductase n=1 Tax=Arthrobacter sp. KK5.5 TaxID=3373084 RepID=UPI003EE64750
METTTEYHRIVILGGGNAGISLAARLGRYGVGGIAVVEPKAVHHFQPLFSHIGAGAAQMREAVRPQEDVMPRDVAWIRGEAAGVVPGENTVRLADGRLVRYGHLVVCPGLQLDWDDVPGLRDAMGDPRGTSNYDAGLVPKTWELVRGLRSGTAVFTQPPGAAKCSGAAQKIAYMACDYWRAAGVLQDIAVVLVVPTPTVFGMPDVDRELERKIAEYGITLRTDTALATVDASAGTVVLDGPRGREEIAYDMLHAVPPQSAPDWLKSSELPAAGDDGGFVEVDAQTLRHPRFPNVWSLGDAAGTPNSKSGGALRKQVKVLAKNLKSVLDGGGPTRRYDGYSVCPFTLSRGTAFFAEFGADYRPMPSIPLLRMAKERRWQWIMDRHVFPKIYWHLILKGRA